MLARAVLQAWRQLASDSRDFRHVLQSVGRRMREGLMVETFGAWRDMVVAKQWKTAAMMRCGLYLLKSVWMYTPYLTRFGRQLVTACRCTAGKKCAIGCALLPVFPVFLCLRVLCFDCAEAVC